MLNLLDSALKGISHEFWGDDKIQPLRQIRESMTMKLEKVRWCPQFQCHNESSQRWRVESYFMSQDDETMNTLPGRLHYWILTLGIVLIILSYCGFDEMIFWGLSLIHEYELREKSEETKGRVEWQIYTQLDPLAELIVVFSHY